MFLSLEPFYGGGGGAWKSRHEEVCLGGCVGGAEVCLRGASAGVESWLDGFEKVDQLTMEASLRARLAV